jgi:gliding motility-associated-like protein
MVEFKRKICYNKGAKIFLIIILFAFKNTLAQPPGNHIETIIPHIADTTRKIITDAGTAPLFLQPIPAKIVCDNDFSVSVSGGTGVYTFISSVPSVATINLTTGEIHLSGSAGQTLITVNDGQESVHTTLIVNEASPPSVTITPVDPTPCQGASVTYTAKTANAGENPSFQWEVNGVAAGTNSDTFSSNTLQTGDQISCILSNNNNHCIPPNLSSNIATITVIPLVTPVVTISSTAEGPVANNTPIAFTAMPTNGGNAPIYQWYVNNTPVGENLPTYSSTCFYNGDVVTCVITNTNGICLGSLTATSNALTVYIIDSAIPVQASISTADNKVYSGTLVYFKATVKNGNALTYQWQVNGENAGVTDSVFSTYTLKNNDKVTCIVTTDNKCNPLITTNEITMIIIPPPPISIPNTFTPNGDGINDTWEIKNLELYRSCTVSIFSRYGTLVYHSTGYTAPWDGKYRNSDLNTGTYYYIIDLGIHTRLLSGPVTVIR